MKNPFRYFDSSPEVIRLVVMIYVRFPLSLRNVEDLLAERGIGLPPRGDPVSMLVHGVCDLLPKNWITVS
jgi:hypothetical protein